MIELLHEKIGITNGEVIEIKREELDDKEAGLVTITMNKSVYHRLFHILHKTQDREAGNCNKKVEV